MSVNCNKAFKLSLESLRDKKRLARNAGIALLGATGDVYKATELAEHGDGAASVGVYVASARAKLLNASALLGEVVAILESGSLSAETTAWHQGLDYDRLYRTGTEDGTLPHGRETWSEFAGTMVKEGPLTATVALRARIERSAGLLAEWLDQARDAGSAAGLTRLTAAVTDLATHARFVSYVNDVEPLDARWLRQPV
ncbi:hypothetical protein [Streptomyces sp. MST-110588]|uniref:hypothetical protein n=1 Tax=Streptomyces sp. MST-110588 TaxID=2833628 RepID=UPI001F5D40F1|nr:hypothetical protein [Streptomyces sp. MST-110588]UNO38870.1 hypothetical protein KGS77_03430 [Streptomyces sp. MST-110588]